ncbi:thioredoxin-disulfide reductase [Tribonema minus]|uniref:Thioredoxin-disulfide reductase n=1 Tax=Tribonema minus TaxID=303371 RepID=A0A835YK56_9STRA|nr:thioredoxin-disulfide reductase [Tribonema minus]
MLTSDVENFPGYREPVPGPDLMEDLRQQAERFGAEVVHRNADTLDASTRPFRVTMRGGKMQVLANSVIISTGAEAQWLGAQNEELVKGAGVSTCATCDGAFYEGKEVLMVGGGDSAITEALFLTRFASKVTILHRREGFRASPIMLERTRTHPKIHILTNKVVKRWLVETPPPLQGEGGGAGAAVLRGAEVTDVVTGEAMELPAAGAFLAVGHKPVTKFLKGSGVELDGEGYIVNRKHTMTSVEGVFACGDVVDKRYRQAITAAGMGCQAAMDAEKWLEGEPF